MRFSNLVNRIAGEKVDAWNIHYAALEAASRGEDVIVLSVGDPEFATPSPIVERAVQALHEGDTHYSPVDGHLYLREKIAALHQQQTGLATQADQVVVVAGTQNGLFSAALCLCQAGDEVLVPEPMYLTYEASIQASGAKLIPVPVEVERGFRINLAALKAAITPRTRAIFMATPCNPTGTVMSREELAGIAQLACEHDLWVLSDEVYAGITFEQPHLSIATLPGMAERTVIISSLSKSHAMAGWRIGWAIGPQALAQHMSNLALCMLYGMPGFVQQAALVAVEGYEQFVGEIRKLYRQRRDLAHQLLNQVPGLSCQLPEAGMFLMLDIRRSGLSAHDFTWQLFQETGVSLLDAQAFGATAQGFVRLGLVVEEARLREACQRIAQFMQQHQKHHAEVLA